MTALASTPDRLSFLRRAAAKGPAVFRMSLAASAIANLSVIAQPAPGSATPAPSGRPAPAPPPPAQPNEELSVKESHSGEFIFSLLPKALQKNPVIFMTVITEMTLAGKRVAAPTAEKPTYYVAETSGYHDEGQGYLGERPLSVSQLQAQMESSLAGAHYLKASPGHPATLALIFLWGADNRLDPGFPDWGHRNLLSRAALVGGIDFAKEFEHVLAQQDDLSAIGGTSIGPTPLEIFMERDDKTRELVQQAADDCYYVVASAYEGAALARGQRILLWRTKMTTNSRGISMAQSLPLLIAGGRSYFGKDMTDAASLEGRPIPEGHVEVGTPVEVNDPPKPH